MKIVYLLRHAKSRWDDPALSDIERPLNKRGKRACRFMARYFDQMSIRPDLTLVSPARRTTETFNRIVKDITAPFEHRIVSALYASSADAVLETIRGVPDTAKRLLIIGHNPALHTLALTLAARARSAQFERLSEKFPTAALAELHFDIDHWVDVRAGTGFLANFVRPRDLEGSAQA